MNESMISPPPIFEYLIHLLEVSVVLGIGAMVYVTKKRASSPEAKKQQNKTQRFNSNIADEKILMFKEDIKK